MFIIVETLYCSNNYINAEYNQYLENKPKIIDNIEVVKHYSIKVNNDLIKHNSEIMVKLKPIIYVYAKYRNSVKETIDLLLNSISYKQIALKTKISLTAITQINKNLMRIKNHIEYLETYTSNRKNLTANRQEIKINCVFCEKTLSTKYPNQKFCSNECRKEYYTFGKFMTKKQKIEYFKQKII